MNSQEANFLKTQAQKRLKILYEYVGSDFDSNCGPEAYYLMHLAGLEDLQAFMTKAEFNVWRDIRVHGAGMQFYPEFPIADDVVDFCAPAEKIVIEVDSKLHDSKKDHLKDIRLKRKGYKVFRINSKDTQKDLEYLQGQISNLRNAGKESIADSLIKNIQKNSEAMVLGIGNKYLEGITPTDEPYGIITLSELSESETFKQFQKKYYNEIPPDLLKKVKSIPLYKNKKVQSNK